MLIIGQEREQLDKGTIRRACSEPDLKKRVNRPSEVKTVHPVSSSRGAAPLECFQPKTSSRFPLTHYVPDVREPAGAHAERLERHLLFL
jgi:hypothetical protein